MKYNPVLDPKFWIAFVDGVVSLALYFAGKYGAPGLLDDVKMVIGFLQPLVAIIIAGVFTAEVIAIRAGKLMRYLKP